MTNACLYYWIRVTRCFCVHSNRLTFDAMLVAIESCHMLRIRFEFLFRIANCGTKPKG